MSIKIGKMKCRKTKKPPISRAIERVALKSMIDSS